MDFRKVKKDQDMQTLLTKMGIQVTEEGIPKLSGPPGVKVCSLCKQMAECPIPAVFGSIDNLKKAYLCEDCNGLLFINPDLFWKKIRKFLKEVEE